MSAFGWLSPWRDPVTTKVYDQRPASMMAWKAIALLGGTVRITSQMSPQEVFAK